MLKRRVRPVVSLVAITAAVALAACSGLTDIGSTQHADLYEFDVLPCTDTAAPRPGWLNCTARAYLSITTTVKSGYVSAYVAYPDAANFYSGETPMIGTYGGNVVVQLSNPYVSKCVPNYHSTLYLYDGRLGDKTKLLNSFDVNMGAFC